MYICLETFIYTFLLFTTLAVQVQAQESELERLQWCASIQRQHNFGKGNTLAYLKGKERDNFVNWCGTTPGSIQHKALKLKIMENENFALFDHPLTDVERWCYETKEKYDIIPGQSFGNMPVSMHPHYLRAKCHRFFCEYDPKAGQGKFKCIPLNKQKIEAE